MKQLKKDKGIVLHPEFGLNPTMSVCMYCLKETGEIALLGNYIKNEAPTRMITSAIPCNDCLEKYPNHTFVCQTTEDDTKKKIPVNKHWLTGNYFIIEKKTPNSPTIALMLEDDFKKIINKKEENL